MTAENEDFSGQSEEAPIEENSENFYIDILTGNSERVTAKKLLIQKVLRLLIETYGFDRSDLEVDYNPRIPGQARRRADIAIFRPGAEHTNANLQRVVVCKPQRRRERLRSFAEAEPDLRELYELL